MWTIFKFNLNFQVFWKIQQIQAKIGKICKGDSTFQLLRHLLKGRTKLEKFFQAWVVVKVEDYSDLMASLPNKLDH